MLTEEDEVDESRFGLPCNQEENSDDSDVDQPNNEPLENSTLFWSTQRLLQVDQENKLIIGGIGADQQMKDLPSILRKI